MIREILCWIGWHAWILDEPEGRYCKHCPTVEEYDPYLMGWH